MEKITPKVDLSFKKIFGVEENKDLLISLINATVAPEDQVVDVTLLNPYNPKNFRSDQLSILDIKAVGETDKRFNIEIQIIDEADKALHVLETMNFIDEERMAYEDHLKWLRIEANTLEKVRREGIQEGQEKGIRIGQEQGYTFIYDMLLTYNNR
ncbi:PD-(D/E)XK nuclease family transposase [Cardinium endosymbiont of Philonthus spinipes]|uniref:PD-(D/E)XK nuclease family transposase n=1 Tax=Cardinium endosymbiont of Philonthus spinipes TaxID=3077941 RepID=UPI00313EF62C